MEDKLLSIILQNTYTISSLYRRLRLAREYLEWQFFSTTTTPVSIEQFITKKEPSELDKTALVEWSDAFYTSFSRASLYSSLKSLQQTIKKLPVITFYVPFIFADIQAVGLGQWLRGNVDTQVLVDLRSDPNLAIGCAFVWKGIFHDYSYRYFLDRHKEEIRQIVNEIGKSSLAPSA